MSSRSDQFDLFDAISDLAPGTHVKVPSGTFEGEWVKLADDGNNWASLKDGSIRHYSYLCSRVWPFEILP